MDANEGNYGGLHTDNTLFSKHTSSQIKVGRRLDEPSYRNQTKLQKKQLKDITQPSATFQMFQLTLAFTTNLHAVTNKKNIERSEGEKIQYERLTVSKATLIQLTKCY